MSNIQITNVDPLRRDFSAVGWRPDGPAIDSLLRRTNFDLSTRAEILPVAETEFMGLVKVGKSPGDILQTCIGPTKMDGVSFANSHELVTVMGYTIENLFNNMAVAVSVPEANDQGARLIITRTRFLLLRSTFVAEVPYASLDHVGYKDLAPLQVGNRTGGIATLFTSFQPEKAGRSPLIFTIALENGGPRDRIAAAWKSFASQIAPADYESWVRSF